jgi:hypothetical protein
MKYKVHQFDEKSKNIQHDLEDFINKLNGEIISALPHLTPTFQLKGSTTKIDYYLIVERIE